jgi:cell shape-determining protein MreD
MGAIAAMNWLNPVLLILGAFLTVFGECAWETPRQWLGVQVDLLPCLAVYAGLTGQTVTLTLVTALGALWFDSLSANPLGSSLPALIFLGFLVQSYRDLIMQDDLLVQIMLGGAACAVAPVITLLFLLSLGCEPLVGWFTLWQVGVMAMSGALAAPAVFWTCRFLSRAFSYPQTGESSFRPDRELKRGRR